MATTGQNGAVPDAATQPTPASSASNTPGTTPATTSSNNASETTATSTANRPIASLRLPPFSTEETELWLSQVECAFGVAGVQDDFSRYQVLVVNLPTEVAIQVRDIINSPNPTYVALTSALKERLAQSRASRLEALLRHQQLGDQRPSDLLRRIQGELSMAGVAPADNGLLRTLYKQRLPQSARAALSLLSDDTPLAELARAADRFMEANAAAGPSLQNQVPVCAVQQPQAAAAAAAPSQSALDQLTASVAALTAAVGQMRTDMEEQLHQDRRGRSYRGRSSSRSSGFNQRSPSRGRQQNGLCFYHFRFGAEARKCTSPCTWRSGNDLA